MKKKTTKNKAGNTGVTTNQNTTVETVTPEFVKVSTVASAEDIESVFKVNALGYYDAHASSVVWTGKDIAEYAFAQIEEGQQARNSAMRKAILTISAAIKAAGDDCVKEIKEALAGKWADQTIAGILSVAKMLPSFELAGVDISKVGDINALREVNKTLKDAKDGRTKKAIVSRLNKGMSPRKVKEEFADDSEEGETEGTDDKSAACETRLQELFKMAKAVAKDCGNDHVENMKIVAKLAKVFGVSLTETPNEEQAEEVPEA